MPSPTSSSATWTNSPADWGSSLTFMDTAGPACPNCGGADTQPVELVWESGRDEPGMADLEQRVAPPTPRAASTNAGWFYLFGFLGLGAWIVAMAYLTNLVAARAASVFFVSGVAAAGVMMMLVRIFTAGPKPTADQNAALEEWRTAHREWQQKHLCLLCGEMFIPRD